MAIFPAHLGGWALRSASLVAALALNNWLAPRFGLARERVLGASLLGLAVSPCAGRLLLIAAEPVLFLRHPWWVLGVVALPEWCVLLADLLGVAATIGYAAAWQVDVRALADALMPGLLLALTFGSGVGWLAFGAGWLWIASLAWMRWGRWQVGDLGWATLVATGMLLLGAENLRARRWGEVLWWGLFTPRQVLGVVAVGLALGLVVVQWRSPVRSG